MTGNRYRHGHTANDVGPYRTTPEYRSWRSMRNRCLKFSAEHASYYGLPIDPRWDDFSNFVADMGRRPSPSHTLDRIDGSKGYGPNNCRWATKREQAQNRRTNVFPGTSVELAATEAGVPVDTVRSRLRRGHTPAAALSGAGIRCGHNGECARGAKNVNAKLNDERVRTILSSNERSTELARQFGVSKSTINDIRARRTWSHVNV